MTYESDPVCPYCDHKVDSSDHDLWEYEGEDNPFECPNCEKELVLNVQVTAEYELKRVECDDDKHEYDEWVRIDVSQRLLDEWAKDSIMSRYADEKPYSWYVRECKNCDDKDHSIKYEYLQEVPQNEIESK